MASQPIGSQAALRESVISRDAGSADELRSLREQWTGDFYNEGSGKDGPFDRLREECGIFGVFGYPNASSLCYYGLHALQHRGEESAGICTRDGEDFHYYRNMGLVKEVFDKDRLQSLKGSVAIGHVRYSTSGESKLANAQPLVFKYKGGDLAICTNGNLVNAPEIRKRLEESGSIFQTTSDTEVMIHLIARSKQPDIVSAAKEALRQVSGGFAFLIMTKDKLLVASDPHGLRPLVMGKLGNAYVFASETCAFETIGASYIRDVQPGELLVLDAGGLHEDRFATMQRRALCAMEYIYFSRPDSDLDGINLHTARKNMGRQLAKEAFVYADVVTGVPDSSISAAIGYAEQTGIPYEIGLIKNRYTGRTFIQPSQELRERGVKMKLSAVRKVVEGKRVVMIDDSIVRGTTSLRIVNMLREAGAKEVHVRISSPPYMNPCFYGIDTPDRKELIASSKTIEEIRQAINADSLHFLSKEGLLAAIGRPGQEYNRGHCTACFDNDYPTPVPDGSAAVGCGGCD
ncbi:amidophosphoribosyltransferase [Paenibacillus thermoaerophilus]|jgi:amidophosphoribosyltransferase|uniref:Amidophosphoribosyltransferase n=1 Tax=Paenibacillus thermoaerophilus TaxID=1215385 RepID=A0ABW2V207_9BACL|nr:amidophosphoribosyltransferase [Paenibacillus thermoaerophilus]TMV13948.1 amidophosphoribosyltransferase [Paenibacillus thermoaerophilus]